MKNKKNKEKLFKFNLQLFAEGSEGQDNNGGNGEGQLQITLETVQNFLNSNVEGKKWFQAQKDSHFSKGLETWKTNNLDKIIEEEINKRFPPETEEQKRLREMEQKLAQIEKEKKFSELKNQAIATATEKGLPVKLVDFFVGEDVETTIANLGVLEEIFNDAVKKAVDERFKQGGRHPKPSSTKSQTNNDVDFAKKMAERRVKTLQNQNDNPYFK